MEDAARHTLYKRLAILGGTVAAGAIVGIGIAQFALSTPDLDFYARGGPAASYAASSGNPNSAFPDAADPAAARSSVFDPPGPKEPIVCTVGCSRDIEKRLAVHGNVEVEDISDLDGKDVYEVIPVTPPRLVPTPKSIMPEEGSPTAPPR